MVVNKEVRAWGPEQKSIFHFSFDIFHLAFAGGRVVLLPKCQMKNVK